MANTKTSPKPQTGLTVRGQPGPGFLETLSAGAERAKQVGRKIKKKIPTVARDATSAIVRRAQNAPLLQRKSKDVKSLREVWGGAVKGPAAAGAALGLADEAFNDVLKEATGGLLGGAVEVSDLGLGVVTAARLAGLDKNSPGVAGAADHVTTAVLTKWGLNIGKAAGGKAKQFFAQMGENRKVRAAGALASATEQPALAGAATGGAAIVAATEAKPEKATRAPAKKAESPKVEDDKTAS